MHNKSKLIFLLLLILISIFLVACTPTETQVRKQLDSANHCKTATDCVNVGPACPFGCYLYVHKAEESKARNVIKSYKTTCALGCLTCEGVECIAGKCQQSC